MEPLCVRCGAPGEFYPNDRTCKVCRRALVRQNFWDRRDQYRDYDRQRFRDPRRKAYIAAKQVRRRAADPERYRARTAVGNAVRRGLLIRQPCQVCGAPGAQAHHARGYANGLDVDWLCFKHHREAHGQKVGKVETMATTTVKRWVGECDFPERDAGQAEYDEGNLCLWNARLNPRLHESKEAAIREARDHAADEGHVGAKQVSVQREWQPRTLAAERIVG